MNPFKNLLVDFRDGIVLVTINRPQALNALNKDTMADLRKLFGETLLEVPKLKGVVLTGAGEKSFVAGADISEFTQLDAHGALEMAQNGHDIFFLIERFHRPVIAAVNGFALGGGCELAMACHLRIGGANAKFGQPEVNLGIIPGYGGTQRLVQLVGKGKALELMMTADIIKVDEAHRLGLVNQITEAGKEVEKAIEIIEKIASKAPGAIEGVLKCVNAYFDNTVNGFEKEVSEFATCVHSGDFKEGAAAFLEKRKPSFTGK